MTNEPKRDLSPDVTTPGGVSISNQKPSPWPWKIEPYTEAEIEQLMKQPPLNETQPAPGRLHEQTGYTACNCPQCVAAREDDRRQWEIEKAVEIPPKIDPSEQAEFESTFQRIKRQMRERAED